MFSACDPAASYNRLALFFYTMVLTVQWFKAFEGQPRLSLLSFRIQPLVSRPKPKLQKRM